MKCVVCQRDSASELCEYHADAKRELESAYPRWKSSFGSLEWSDYLDAVSKNPETGIWVVEVVKLMRGRPSGESAP